MSRSRAPLLRLVLSRARMAMSLALALALIAGDVWAQSGAKNLAPGFTQLPAAAKIIIMPIDVELFSLSMGGIAEPRADWTAAALGHMKATMTKRVNASGLDATLMDDTEADEFAELIGLHAAIAQSIALHHSLGGAWALPTKAGLLDWSFDDAMQPLQRKTGARYGLFVYVRDSYASGERKAAMVAMALLGVAMMGGSQVGYASLVDLETGRVLWFNRLARTTGDLREPGAAAESIDALLTGFPRAR